MKRNETCSDISKFKNAYLSETNELAGKQLCVQTETKAKWLVARQVMQ